MPKISCLVSAYYAEEFMHQRLINLYGQKVDLEIIVVAQKDSKEETIASQYNLKVVPTLNIPSIGEAWNLAMEHATGDYLTTANTDDRYTVGGLARMVDVLEQKPEIDLVFSQVDIDTAGSIKAWQRIENPTGEVDILPTLKQRCIIGPMPVWRNNGMRFDEGYTVASDYDMWLRMAKAGMRFYYIAESCGVYVQRPDSLEYRNRELCTLETRMVQCE